MRHMYKIKAGLCILISMVMLTACTSGSKAQESTMIIDKNGSITSVIVEGFEEYYYTQEDFENFVRQDVAAYNAGFSDAPISVSKVAVRNEIITVEMKYASAQDYAAYNRLPLFIGTVAEAYDAGYDLDVTLNSTTETEKKISKSEILGMGDRNIIIAEENVVYQLPSKALYIGQNEEIMKNTSVRKADGSQTGSLYIIY